MLDHTLLIILAGALLWLCFRFFGLFQQVGRQLHETEGEFRQLAEHIREILWLGSPTLDQIYYVSPAYEMVWGRSCESLYRAPLSWLDAIDPQDRPRMEQVVQTSPSSYDEEYRVVRPDGSVRWVRDRAFPVRDGKGQVIRVAGLAEDITELKQAQQGMMQTEKMAALGRFSANLAHEVKNPLAIILGCTEFIERSFNSQEARAQEAFHAIYSAIDRADYVVRSLLEFGKPSQLHKEELKVENVIRSAVAMFQEQAVLHHIGLKTYLPDESMSILADKNQIQQVLVNLLMNATEALPKGGSIRVEVKQQQAAGQPPQCVITVADDGEGISQENVARLFEPFFTSKRNNKGTGLGLVITKAIVENHGGNLKLQSQLGKGTCVTLTLPALTEGVAHEADSHCR